MKKRWKINPVDEKIKGVLEKELNILPTTAQLLINRGLVDTGMAFSFLSPDLNSLHNPFLMKDMDRAVTRIIDALARKEKLSVFGDYDVDGITSTALVYLFFRDIGADVITYIPDRKTEGYGLNIPAIKALSERGARLIITVDCGVSNHEEIQFAKTLGIDTIVTDHHQVTQGESTAWAVLNPHQEGCNFPFKGLSGVGVAFNLVIALRARLKEMGWFNNRQSPNLKRYLDIVGIGTVSDMVPLVDENRVFVRYGLSELNCTKRPGLKALIDISGLTLGRINEENIAFQLAPRLNASGRIERAETSLSLLVTEDPKEAVSLARALNNANSSRQGIEEKIFKEALEMAGDASGKRVIVLASETWHPGVIGIVAGRLAERFSRPVVLVAIEGGIGKGSVRGVKGCDVISGLKACSALLERYGGHRMAAGLTLKKERFGDFKESYADFMDRTLTDEDLVEEVCLDCAVTFGDISERLISEIEKLSPFGRSNEKPLLLATQADILLSEVVGERHLRMAIRQDGRTQNAIAFNMGSLHPVKGSYDIAFYPYIDEWRGARRVRLRVKDLKECLT